MKQFAFALGAVIALAAATPATADVQLMGVRENIAVQTNPAEMQDHYKDFAAFISQVTGNNTLIEAAQDPRSLEGLRSGRYALMFIRPAGLTAKAIRDQHYVLIAEAKNPVYPVFMVNGNSPLKKPQDIAGKRIAMPDNTSYIGKLAAATLHSRGLDPAKLNIQYTRYQDSVEYIVRHNMADVGVVAPVMATPWEKKGGVVLFKGQAAPSWSVVASPKMPAAQAAKLQDALLNMENTDAGKKILTEIGVTGFQKGNPDDYMKMAKKLGI